MSLNLIDLIKGQLGPALISQVASQNGESEAGIQKAISGLLPAVIGGLANNSNNSNLLDAVTSPSASGLLGNLLGGSSNNSLITTVINSLFGDKLNGLLGTVASFAGINNSSASSLLNLVTGATLGSVGKYAADNNLDRLGISNLLGEQKGIVSSLLPAGLSLASLGFGNLFGGDKDNVKVTSSVDEPRVTRSESTRTHTPPPSYNNNDDNGGGSIWKWLLPLLLLGLVAWFLFKQCGNKTEDTTVVTNEVVEVDSDTLATAPTTTVTKVDEDIDLNGVALKGYKGGLEDSMISFLKSGNYDSAANDDALKDVWYDFDKVNFKIGSSTELEAGSKEQLDNLVAILKAYPNAKVKIGGYTDKTGNEADNKKRSKARAEFIKTYLSDASVGGQVISAEGYGSEFATQPATATNEERAIDRKMAVRFAK